jgi:hypothetical protein
MGAIARSTSNRLARGIPFFEKTKQGPVHLETIAGAQKNRIVRCSTAYSPSKRGGGARGGKAVHAMLFLDRRALVGGNFVGGTNFNFQSLKDVRLHARKNSASKNILFP